MPHSSSALLLPRRHFLGGLLAGAGALAAGGRVFGAEAALPSDPASSFIITSVQVSGSDIVLTWKTVVGKRHRVHTLTDLAAGS